MKIFSLIFIFCVIVFGGFWLLNLNPSNPKTTPSDSRENSTSLDENTLDLSGQQLTRIPDSVFSQTNLEHFIVSNNKLTGSIQGEIRFLQKLRSLNASNNALTGVPAEIGQLTNLEILDLSNNQLTGLPYELGNLKNLRILNLSGNQYSEADLQTIQKQLPTSVQIITGK